MSWRLKEKARGLLRREKGAIKRPWGGRISVGLVYPHDYRVGMANLGFQAVYRIINELSFAVCERVFLPDRTDLKEFERSSTPLFSLESQQPLHSFDVVAFSLSFENDYPNVLTLLDLSQIPLRAVRRNAHHPLVLAGGICTFLNPEPLAEFMDFFAIGEAEDLVPECLTTIAASKGSGKSRHQMLAMLAGIQGVYVPRFYTVTYHESGPISSCVPANTVPSKVKRRWIKNPDRQVTHSIVTSPDMEFNDLFLIEIGRGCSYGCRFCASGWVYRPARMRSLKSLEECIKGGLERKNKLGLVSAAIGDHPELKDICRFIREKGGGISVSSLRAKGLSGELIDVLRESGHQSVTLAPETGSERLRWLVNKRITDDEIVKAAEVVVSHGIPNLRLYFLLGLPTEEHEDIEQIVSLTKRLKHTIIKTLRKESLPGAITLCLTPFVPKPFTPFQWVPFEKVNVLNQKIRHIQSGLKKERQVYVTFDSPKWSYIQALLSRGDRRVAKILLAVHQAEGDWRKAFQQTDINPDFYVYRQRELTEVLPWDFIEHGFDKEKLIAEYHRAFTDY